MCFQSAKKIKFSVKNFFSKCAQTRRKLRIWSHLLKKSLIEYFIFCAVEDHFDSILFLVSCVAFAIIPGGRKFVILIVEIKSAGHDPTENERFQNLKILYKLQIIFIALTIDLQKTRMQFLITKLHFLRTAATFLSVEIRVILGKQNKGRPNTAKNRKHQFSGINYQNIDFQTVSDKSDSGMPSTKRPLKLNHNHKKSLSEEDFEGLYNGLQLLHVRTFVLLFKRCPYLDIMHTIFENISGLNNKCYICKIKKTFNFTSFSMSGSLKEFK